MRTKSALFEAKKKIKLPACQLVSLSDTKMKCLVDNFEKIPAIQ